MLNRELSVKPVRNEASIATETLLLSDYESIWRWRFGRPLSRSRRQIRFGSPELNPKKWWSILPMKTFPVCFVKRSTLLQPSILTLPLRRSGWASQRLNWSSFSSSRPPRLSRLTVSELPGRCESLIEPFRLASAKTAQFISPVPEYWLPIVIRKG